MRSGTTQLDHGMGGGEHRVSSCSEAGCSVHRVAYDAPMKQMAALMALSAQCEQHVKVGTRSYRVFFKEELLRAVQSLPTMYCDTIIGTFTLSNKLLSPSL